MECEIKRHRVIRIGSCNFLSLCCYNYWTRLWCFQMACCSCFSSFWLCFKDCLRCCNCFIKCCSCLKGCCSCFDCFDRRHALMVEKSRDRLKKDMNLVDIIKKLRYHQVMMNSTNIQSESRRLKLAHTFQSVINIE